MQHVQTFHPTHLLIFSLIGNLVDLESGGGSLAIRKLQYIELNALTKKAAISGSLATFHCLKLLELKSERKLHDPRRIGSDNLPKCSCVYIRQLEVILEVGIVEHIECLHSKLKLHSFSKAEVLQ